MHILLYLIFCSLYLIFYSFYFMHTSLVLYSTIFALSMERTRLSFHCWLYNLCIVVYVTNKTWTWNWVLLRENMRLILKSKPSAVTVFHPDVRWQPAVFSFIFIIIIASQALPDEAALEQKAKHLTSCPDERRERRKQRRAAITLQQLIHNRS